MNTARKAERFEQLHEKRLSSAVSITVGSHQKVQSVTLVCWQIRRSPHLFSFERLSSIASDNFPSFLARFRSFLSSSVPTYFPYPLAWNFNLSQTDPKYTVSRLEAYSNPETKLTYFPFLAPKDLLRSSIHSLSPHPLLLSS